MVRFGIVGFGLHAVRRLMPGFALATNCQVTALSRRNQSAAQAAARRYDIGQVFASTADLCRSQEVDAVLVTTPNSAHLDDVLASVAAGKPVLCEKPMGMSAAECRRMVEAARQSNVLLGVAHVFRFEESVGRLRERVATGEIGTPAFARSEFSFMAGPDHGRTWIYDPQHRWWRSDCGHRRALRSTRCVTSCRMKSFESRRVPFPIARCPRSKSQRR